MPRIEPYYRQLPKFTITGLTLKMQAWRFSYGAIDPADPAYIFRDLSPLDIAFTADPIFDKFATLYIVPTATLGDNYYITAWNANPDPTLAGVSNPPTEKWTPDISVVPCLNIVIKAGATMLEVTVNEFDLPDPPDPRHDVVHNGLHVKAWPTASVPAGWEKIDAIGKHTALFGDNPVSLGRLIPDVEAWFVEVK